MFENVLFGERKVAYMFSEDIHTWNVLGWGVKLNWPYDRIQFLNSPEILLLGNIQEVIKDEGQDLEQYILAATNSLWITCHSRYQQLAK